MRASVPGLAALGLLSGGPAAAQSFPAKPVRIIVAFPAGGGTDITARVIAPKLTDIWSQQVLVDNRPGASMLGKSRSPTVADVPTMDESGVPGYELTNWFGLVLPGATPQEVSRKIAADVRKVLGPADLREKFAAMGAAVVGSTPEQFGAFMRAESDKWAQLIAEAGIRVQ